MGKEKLIVLPSVTTVGRANWRQMIDDVKINGLSEVGLFLTGLDFADRQECFRYLKQLDGLEIPFVHAKSDVRKVEYQYLMDQFGTTRFNLHADRFYPIKDDLGELKNHIYIENSGEALHPEDLEGFAGLCLDLAHLTSTIKLDWQEYLLCYYPLICKYPVGANHISAIGKELRVNKETGWQGYDKHTLSCHSELDYLTGFSGKYFGKYLALELTNPINEQLAAKKYIENLLNL